MGVFAISDLTLLKDLVCFGGTVGIVLKYVVGIVLKERFESVFFKHCF